MVNWRMGTTNQTYTFEVEHSADGTNFAKIGTVDEEYEDAGGEGTWSNHVEKTESEDIFLIGIVEGLTVLYGFT